MSYDNTVQQTEHGFRFVADILESRPLTPTSHHIRISRPPEFDFEPVQHTILSLNTTGEAGRFDASRPMSLASSPTREYLEYGVNVSESDFKQAFVDLEPGDEVLVEGPRGDFILNPRQDAVLVAGGIGITPLKGMAEYATDNRLDIHVRLVYSNRTSEEIAYWDELQTLAESNSNFEIVHTLTRESEGSKWPGRRGRIDGALLEQVTVELDAPAFYLCGTPEMVQGLRRTLQSIDVPNERIKYERFWGYDY